MQIEKIFFQNNYVKTLTVDLVICLFDDLVMDTSKTKNSNRVLNPVRVKFHELQI